MVFLGKPWFSRENAWFSGENAWFPGENVWFPEEHAMFQGIFTEKSDLLNPPAPLH